VLLALPPWHAALSLAISRVRFEEGRWVAIASSITWFERQAGSLSVRLVRARPMTCGPGSCSLDDVSKNLHAIERRGP